jgi:hypothetical protein
MPNYFLSAADEIGSIAFPGVVSGCIESNVNSVPPDFLAPHNPRASRSIS